MEEESVFKKLSWHTLACSKCLIASSCKQEFINNWIQQSPAATWSFLITWNFFFFFFRCRQVDLIKDGTQQKRTCRKMWDQLKYKSNDKETGKSYLYTNRICCTKTRVTLSKLHYLQTETTEILDQKKKRLKCTWNL